MSSQALAESAMTESTNWLPALKEFGYTLLQARFIQLVALHAELFLAVISCILLGSPLEKKSHCVPYRIQPAL
jgi:hypothetical protein